MIIQAITPFKYNNKQHSNNTTFTSSQRVDKDLDRFYDFNKNRMPVSMYRYVDSLEDKSRLTPVEAQRRAFHKLESAETIEDIKKAFPDEPLFAELKNPSESGAMRGLPALDRKLGKDLEDLGIGILKSKENLTVYLVKKTFLEVKTIEEINKDLEEDVEDIVKSEFKSQYPNTQYISKSNMRSLGIKFPTLEYWNSLKFTKEGYADKFAETASLAQKIFWDSLSDEQKNARARKSLEKFENWWASIDNDKKLEMIAEQDNTLDMLKDFKRFQIENQEKKDSTTTTPVHFSDAVRSRTKIHSQKLSQDDLFKRWASNNLKIYEEQLSEEDKIKLHEKRMYNAIRRWQEMSPVEKTEYLARLKAGSEPLRYVMINSWNNSFDIVVALSNFMREKQMEKPEDELYSKGEYSKYMSQIMTEFWAEHQQEAAEFGREISKSWELVNNAINNGEFEQLKISIDENRLNRIQALKLYNSIDADEIYDSEGDYIYNEAEIPEMFKQYFYGEEDNNRIFNRYFDDVAKDVLSQMDENQKKAFHAYLYGNLIFSDFDEDLKDIIRPTTKRHDLAFVNAANIALNDCIPNMPYKYMSELKYIFSQMEKGKHKIEDFSGNSYKVKGRFNDYKLFNLYNSMKQDLSKNEINSIINRFFIGTNPDAHNAVRERLNIYGQNARYIFSEKSPLPFATRQLLYDDFRKGIDLKGIHETMLNAQYVERQANAKNFATVASRTCGFFPQDFMKTFIEVCQKLNDSDFNEMYTRLATKNNINAKMATVLSMPALPVNLMSIDEKLKFIAFEKVMTDILSVYTTDARIYNYQFEDLCNPLVTTYKEYKKGTELVLEGDNGITFTVNKSPNFKKVNIDYQTTLSQCKQWYKENKNNPNKNEALEDLVYILNPQQKTKFRDMFILDKLRKYNLQYDI